MSLCPGRSRESPPAAAARRPGRVALVSFDGPSGALNRSSERRFNCGQPSMHFLGRRQSRRLRLAVPGSGRQPLRRDFVRDHANPRDCRLPAARGSANGRGGLDPRRRNVSPRQSTCAPAVAGRPRRYPKVRGGRLPSRACPCRRRIGDMAYRALPGASPRSPRYSRGLARRTR